MKAAYIEDFCGADGIRYGDLPDPVPGAGEVLVRPAAVAVDTVDTYVRSGTWRTPVTFPLVLGRDLTGTVVSSGAGEAGMRPGEAVWTNSAGYGGRPGATAAFAVVRADRLYRLPEGADPVRFVAAVHPGATAYGVLAGRARVADGETVAIIGANGAVGMCLVQVAAAFGAAAVAVVRDGRAASRLRELGARSVAVAADAGQALGAARAAAPGGIDVLVDTTGRVPLDDAPEVLNARGRIVLIAGGGQIGIDRWRFYTSELQVLGFIMSGMTAAELAAAAGWINARHAERPLTVSVGRVMGFADAGLAHALLDRGEAPRMADRTVGRTVLVPGGSR